MRSSGEKADLAVFGWHAFVAIVGAVSAALLLGAWLGG
jgi:hypothetical protein